MDWWNTEIELFTIVDNNRKTVLYFSRNFLDVVPVKRNTVYTKENYESWYDSSKLNVRSIFYDGRRIEKQS